MSKHSKYLLKGRDLCQKKVHALTAMCHDQLGSERKEYSQACEFIPQGQTFNSVFYYKALQWLKEICHKLCHMWRTGDLSSMHPHFLSLPAGIGFSCPPATLSWVTDKKWMAGSMWQIATKPWCAHWQTGVIDCSHFRNSQLALCNSPL